MIPTQWTSDRHPVGTQLQLSHCARPGELAQVSFSCIASHRPENHVVPRIREDWRDTPTWKARPDEVPWEWVQPEPAFWLQPGDIVLVIGASRLTHVVPNQTEPWSIPLACVQRLNDPSAKVGWVNAWWLDVPFLLNS